MYLFPYTLFRSLSEPDSFADFLLAQVLIDSLLNLVPSLPEKTSPNSLSIQISETLKNSFPEYFKNHTDIELYARYNDSFFISLNGLIHLRKYFTYSLPEIERGRSTSLFIYRSCFREIIAIIDRDCIIPSDIIINEDAENFISVFEFHYFKYKFYEENLKHKLFPRPYLKYLQSNPLSVYKKFTYKFLKALHGDLPRKSDIKFENYLPTLNQIDSLVIPKSLINRLLTYDIESYLKGLKIFNEHNDKWVPKKTLKAIETYFYFPLEVKYSLEIDDVDKYLETVNILEHYGLTIVNTLPKPKIHKKISSFLSLDIFQNCNKNETDFEVKEDTYNYLTTSVYPTNKSLDDSKKELETLLLSDKIDKICLLKKDFKFTKKSF